MKHFELIPSGTNFDFVKYQKTWIAISVLTFLGAIAAIAIKGFNYGIDFTGGAVIQVKFKEATETGVLRGWLEKENVNFSLIQQIGDISENEFQLKLQGNVDNLQQLQELVQSALVKTAGADKFEIRKADVVGPQAGEELRWNSMWAMIYAVIGIVLYVIVRFDARYSPGALVSVGHDAVIVAGIFAITQQEFNLQFVAAILTIIGYSINDTIVVFDRVREVMRANPKGDLSENINRSINETLSRTVITGVTTLLSLTALYFFGGSIIRDFAEALFIGIIIGTYSSIFVAAPIFLWMAKRQADSELRAKTA